MVEFLEILGESDVPIFSNMTADNLPDDNMVREEMLKCFVFYCKIIYFLVRGWVKECQRFSTEIKYTKNSSVSKKVVPHNNG